MIRSAIRTAVREAADAVGSTRWSDAEVNRLIGSRQLAWWRAVLDANPDYTFFSSSATTDANGRINASFTNGAGDAAYKLYRIRGVVRDGIPLQEVSYSDYKTAAQFGADLRAYYRVGSQLQLLPLRQGDSITVTYNGVPVRADLLSADSAEVVFPENFDNLLIYDTAYAMLNKSGMESGPASGMLGLINTEANDMLATVARISTNPKGWRYADDGLSWGSN